MPRLWIAEMLPAQEVHQEQLWQSESRYPWLSSCWRVLVGILSEPGRRIRFLSRIHNGRKPGRRARRRHREGGTKRQGKEKRRMRGRGGKHRFFMFCASLRRGCACTCTHGVLHAHTAKCIFSSKQNRVHTHIFACMKVTIHEAIHESLRCKETHHTYTNTNTHIHTHTHMHAYKHTHLHTYTHIYTHTHHYC